MAETKTYNIKGTSALNSSLMDLPFMKHFSQDEIVSKVNTFRKGEKGLFWFLKLALFGGLTFAIIKWVLPAIFIAIGQILAVAATIGIVVFLIITAPAIGRWMRNLARFLHKSAIKYDPFLQFEIKRKQIIQNQTDFRLAKGKIVQLRSDMENESAKSEKDAEELQKRIISLQGKVEKTRNELTDMVKTMGQDAKTDDRYVDKSADLMKMLADSQTIGNQLAQAKDFIQKYGSRGAIMKKLSQKLKMVETGMEIKLSDFDATVLMLRKDFEFSSKSRAATDAAKSAMLFNSGWELEYAIEVVSNTISEDIAITAGNMKDIDTLTSQYSIDNDDLYTNLNLLAENIKTGKDELPSAKSYTNPDYALTQSDKVKSGGLSNIFD